MKRVSELSEDALAELSQRVDHELPEAPAWLVDSAMAMWRAPQPAPSLGRRLVAVLGFDSWAAQPALALRSAAPAARQMLFTGEGRDVDLRIAPAAAPGAGWVLSGQVLGPGDDGIALLSREGEALPVCALNDFGEFHFADLAAGRYELRLHFGDDELVLPDLDLGVAPQP